MLILSQKLTLKMNSQTTLLNFSKTSLVKTLNLKLILSKNNVLCTQPICCPRCNNLCVYNGFSHKGNYNPLAKKMKFFSKKISNIAQFAIKHIKLSFQNLKNLIN